MPFCWIGCDWGLPNKSTTIVLFLASTWGRAISQGLGLFIKFNRKIQHQMILIELWPTLHTLQKMFNWLVNKYPHFKLNLACSGLLSCRVLLMFWSARETKTSQTLRCARWFTGSFKVFSPCQAWGAGGLLWRKRFNQTLQHQKPHKRMIKTSRTGRKINHQTWGFIYQKKIESIKSGIQLIQPNQTAMMAFGEI